MEVRIQVNCYINSNLIIIIIWRNCYSKVISADLERELNKVKYSKNKIEVFHLYVKNSAVEGHDQGKICLKYIQETRT